MSKNQIDELFERVIKELLEEYEKEKPKEPKKELISFDMALNYILAEYRKDHWIDRVHLSSVVRLVS